MGKVGVVGFAACAGWMLATLPAAAQTRPAEPAQRAARPAAQPVLAGDMADQLLPSRGTPNGRIAAATRGIAPPPRLPEK